MFFGYIATAQGQPSTEHLINRLNAFVFLFGHFKENAFYQALDALIIFFICFKQALFFLDKSIDR